jgi:NAD(P)-dependent dehydrogenase (short-subunit alcohol dehydrogenase family)
MSSNPFPKIGNAHADLADLAGGVAIVTGGASGIGYALAERSLAHGMHTVLADIDADAIAEAEQSLGATARAANVEVFGNVVDVSSEDSVARLAEAVAERFAGRPISLLCCNAGVGGGGSVLSAPDVDWDFVLGVNVKGVANCVRAFVPGMLEQGAPGSVVTTASQDGLCAAQGVYGVSKHACVALTEALHGEVRGRVTVHVLCPNVVGTNIVKSEKHRPERFGGPRVRDGSEAAAASERLADRFKEKGMAPSLCAEYVFNAITTGDFYVLAEAPEDEGHVRHQAETRMTSILNGERPFRPRSDYIAEVFNMGRPR